jgi:hypothetical protein
MIVRHIGGQHLFRPNDQFEAGAADTADQSGHRMIQRDPLRWSSLEKILGSRIHATAAVAGG